MRTRQFEAVRALTTEITRELNLTRLLDLIIHRAVELVGAELGAVYLWDDAAQLLVPCAWYGLGDWMGQVRFRPGEGIPGTVAQERKGILVNDYRTSKYVLPLLLERTGITAAMGEPLLYRDRLVGVITINHERTGRPFTQPDRQILALFAAQAAIAIENARLFAAAEGRTEELSTLREIDQAITARLDLPAVLEAVVAGAMRFLGTQHVQITLWDEATQRLRFGAAVGTEAERVRYQSFELGRGANGTVALSRQPLMINNYQAFPRALPDWPEVLATLSVPLLFEDRLLGILHTHTTTPGKHFTPDDLRRFQMLAAQAAIAIENARLFTQVVRAKAEWEQTFDSISDLVALIDSEYRLVRVNRALAQRLGVPPKALVGQPCYAVLHGRHAPWPECPHARTLLDGRPITQEVEDPHRGGIFLVTTSPLRNAEDQILGSVHIARDITEQKRLETEVRQRERFEDLSRAKSAFIATMSHELRTPLNSVIGFAELLRQEGAGPLTEKQTRYLDYIQQSGKHLLALIGDILDLSKIEAGKIVLAPQPLSVGTTLEDLLVLARGLATRKGQEIQLAMPPGLPPLQADPVRFKQILFNLLSNAVKFTPNGGLITVTARRVEGPPDQLVHSVRPVDQSTPRPIDTHGAWLELCITDTGIGIKAEDVPRLFKEFVQLETTQAQKHDGTGLGLVLAKQLVELHGGRIWAESAGEGRGSTFTVVLPFSGPEALGETSEVISNPVGAVASIGGRPDDRISGERIAA